MERSEIEAAKAALDAEVNAELAALWQRACARAGRQINPSAENLEQWLDEVNGYEITAYRILIAPADRAH